MVGRTDFIRSLKRHELEEFMCKLKIPFQSTDTVDTLRRICCKYLKDQNVPVTSFPVLEGISYDGITGDSTPLADNPFKDVLDPFAKTGAIPKIPKLTLTLTEGAEKLEHHTDNEDEKRGKETPVTSDDVSVAMLQVLQKMQLVQETQLNKNKYDLSPKVEDFRKLCLRTRVRYDGQRSGSVLRFLEQLLAAKAYYKVSDEDVFEVLPELLEKDAEIFFRSRREEFFRFEEFCVALKESFLPLNYQKQLLDEIRQRTQGASEPIDIFVDKIRATNKRLTEPLEDNSLIEIIVENLHPRYIPDVVRSRPTNFPELYRLGRRVEMISSLMQEYKPPKSTSKLDATLNVIMSKSCGTDPVVASASVTPKPSSSVTASTMRPDQRPSFACFNCGADNHVFRDCTVERTKIFCFRCGKKGVTSARCGCPARRSINVSSISDVEGKEPKAENEEADK